MRGCGMRLAFGCRHGVALSIAHTAAVAAARLCRIRLAFATTVINVGRGGNCYP